MPKVRSVKHTNTTRASRLIEVMRLAAIVQEMEVCSLDELADAVEQVRKDFASGRLWHEQYLDDAVSGTSYQEVLQVIQAGQPTFWKDGRQMEHGDFIVAYSHPALLYGIAIGLCLSEGPTLGQPEVR